MPPEATTSLPPLQTVAPLSKPAGRHRRGATFEDGLGEIGSAGENRSAAAADDRMAHQAAGQDDRPLSGTNVPPLTMPPDATITVTLAGILPDSVKPEPTSKRGARAERGAESLIGAAADELQVPPESNSGAAAAAGDRDLEAALADGRETVPPESTISVPPLFTSVLPTTVPLVSSNAPLLTTQAPPLPLTFQWPPTR